MNISAKIIDRAFGNVLTYGLGLGYFQYMVSNKENVSKVTIIEKNKDIIKLFVEYILPQFPNKDKIKIICMDAFEYATNNVKDIFYDFIYADLWHDVSDGIEMYPDGIDVDVAQYIASLIPSHRGFLWSIKERRYQYGASAAGD